jgi:hypothetical protein
MKTSREDAPIFSTDRSHLFFAGFSFWDWVTNMAIKIPDTLPAFATLVSEGVRVMTDSAALRQDIRPLQIGLLNLMPNKIKTEVQMARLVGASPLQVEFSLIRLGTHKAKNTSEEHLLSFYHTWEEVKDRKFDGFIITGAPVETMAYEDVNYWDDAADLRLDGDERAFDDECLLGGDGCHLSFPWRAETRAG